jgi:uncharacterized protein
MTTNVNPYGQNASARAPGTDRSSEHRKLGLPTLRATMAAWFMVAAIAGTAVAGPFEDAIAARDRGDYVTALRLYRQLADQGDARAQYNLGNTYHDGRGVPQNYAEAIKWWRKAADQGFANAQHNLGFMYENGQGVPQNYAEAVEWYRKAADRGFAKAQSNLGFMYENGRGVSQNYAEAIKWWRKAAEQGLASAQHNLGHMYFDGRRVPQNYAEGHLDYFTNALHGL